MGNTAEKNIEKYPHMMEAIQKYESDAVTLSDEAPLYRYDFFERNRQLLDFHIMSQTKSKLLNTIYDGKTIYRVIFEFADMKDIFNLSITCRVMYVYWTRDDEIWRNLLSPAYKTSILANQPLSYHTYGIRSWKDCCKNIYCKEMWKRLQLQYEFVSGSMCSNGSDDDEEDIMLDANSSKKGQSKKSDKSSNQSIAMQPQTEELRIHFICDEKKSNMTRYLKSILKHCKEPQDTNYRLSKKFSSYFDRRVARVKERTIVGNSTSTSTVSHHSPRSSNSEYEIQCLVGTTLRPNCSCKFICIDLTDNSYHWDSSFSNQDIIKDYLSREMECGDTIREYLTNSNSCNCSQPNLSLVVVGLNYERKNELNQNMIRLTKALSNEYSLPYIEIDIGKRNQRRDLLFFYSIYCHSKKMTPHQLIFLQTNNTNDEWLF